MEQILKDFVRSALVDNPNRPENIEELDDYEWVSTDGQHGIVVNGLPRYIG